MLKSHYKDFARAQDKLWWFLGMKAISRSLLDLYLLKKRPLKILDAGCGPGAMLPLLASYGDVIGVDISDEALKFAKKRGKVFKGNVMDLKFKKETFDIVVCMDVLYHMWISDESKALNEFNRVLKKGGLLLIREPAYNWIGGKEDVGSQTGRRFTKGTLNRLVKKASFKVVKITYANFFLFPVVLVLRAHSSLSPKDTKGSSDLNVPGPVVNNLLLSFLKAEAWIMRFASLPFGSSLFFVAHKV